VFAEMAVDVIDHCVALNATEATPEEFHHAYVGIHRRKRIPIRVTPSTQADAVAGQCHNGAHRAQDPECQLVFAEIAKFAKRISRELVVDLREHLQQIRESLLCLAARSSLSNSIGCYSARLTAAYKPRIRRNSRSEQPATLLPAAARLQSKRPTFNHIVGERQHGTGFSCEEKHNDSRCSSNGHDILVPGFIGSFCR
jgi:hypothetical protein